MRLSGPRAGVLPLSAPGVGSPWARRETTEVSAGREGRRHAGIAWPPVTSFWSMKAGMCPVRITIPSRAAWPHAHNRIISTVSPAIDRISPECRGSGSRASLSRSGRPRDVIMWPRGAVRPSFASMFALSRTRGRREGRVRAAPAVSCAMCTKSAHTSIQVQRRASGLPCAMVLRLMARSPW
jgi:hypothetical protein